MASGNLKKVLKRLEKDLKELNETPLPNIAATPLESNMLEWHCNIYCNDNIYHMILFFPEEYPCVSPNLEVMPPGFSMMDVVTKVGQKGTQICLNIFSDFAEEHPEWMFDIESGWSPSYTVQTVLLNLLSYFHDKHQDEDTARKGYLEMSRKFVCPDCGHSQDKPFPSFRLEERAENDCHGDDERTSSLHEVEMRLVEKTDSLVDFLETKIVDYMSREKFSSPTAPSKEHLFGYGLVLSPYSDVCCPQSPCEFITANSFNEMFKVLGEGKSILKESLTYFLPLYITDDHGAKIKHQFEVTMSKIAKKFRFKFSFTNNYYHVIVNVFCSLLTSIVNQTCWTAGDSILDGYFQLHRLFLWALDTYPKVRKCVDKRIQSFLDNPNIRKRKFGNDFYYLFSLLSVSTKYRWEAVAETYLREHWRRSVHQCLIGDSSFNSMNMPMDERLSKTFDLSKHMCMNLSCQVAFLRLARPEGMSKEEILCRYANNCSFPSQEMVSTLRKMLKTINEEVRSFDDWFHVIGLKMPCKEDLFNDLKDSVRYATKTRGYH